MVLLAKSQSHAGTKGSPSFYEINPKGSIRVALPYAFEVKVITWRSYRAFRAAPCVGRGRRVPGPSTVQAVSPRVSLLSIKLIKKGLDNSRRCAIV